MKTIEPAKEPTAEPSVQTGQDRQTYRTATRNAEIGAAVGRLLALLLLIVASAAFMVPLYLMLTMALKSSGEIARTSPWAWPQNLTWDNFKQVIQNDNAPFLLFFRNSTIIATLSTTGVLISSSLVAYAFARLQFRGRDRLFILLMSTMMLPAIVTMIPTYVLYKYLHWVDTFYPLIVPAWFGGGAFNIFLLRQFFMGVPRELDEAAILDGASHAVIFWRILMPLSGPALATVGIFAFVFNWRDFLGPLIYLNSPEHQTLEMGLRTYQSLHDEHWDLLMAGSVLVMIPLLTLFLLGQRYFVKGIVMSGLK